MTPRVDLSSIVSKQSPALLLVNPEAGGGRAGKFAPRVERYFSTQDFPIEIVRTTSAQDLEARAREAILGDRRLLAAMGGDGTFQGLANAAFGADVVLGLIPAGGGNDFSAALGIPRDPIAAARAMLHGEARGVELLHAKTADGKSRFYCGGGGIGLDAETAKYASGIFRRWPGTLRYAASALRALRGFVPLDVQVDFPDGEERAVKAQVLLATVLNTPTYGAGLKLVPGARPDDGWLHVVLVGELRWMEVLELLPRLFLGKSIEIPQLQRYRARQVRLSANRPCAFHGDGEIFGPAPVEVELVQRAIRVLAPRTD